jgi:hypothetical protein
MKLNFNKPILILVNHLPFNYSGISIYPFIIIQKDKLNFKLLKHEYIHYLQAKRQYVILFFVRYLIQNLLVGYSLNIYELEADGKVKPKIKTKLLK